jgi:hypothetical protein
MYRLILMLFLCCSMYAEDLKTHSYDLEPFVVDVLKNWSSMKGFPYERHYFWEGDDKGISDVLIQSAMTKKYSPVKLADLQKHIIALCKSLGFNPSAGDVDVIKQKYGDKFISRTELYYRFKLNLRAPTRVHQFLENINHVNGYCLETKQLNIRLTVLSLPPELVRNKGLDFFPAVETAGNSAMTNKEFALFLKKVKKTKNCHVLTEMTIPSVSGKTVVGRNVTEHLFPESYGYIDEESPYTTYDEAGNPSTEFVHKNVSGISPQFGESREVGVIFEVTPQVEPDNKTVSLDMKPLLLELIGWTQYNDKYNVKMPVIKALTDEFRMTSRIGNTYCFTTMYNKSLNHSSKNLILAAEYNELDKEKCFVFYIGIEEAVSRAPAKESKDSMSFYMNPVGDKCNLQLQMLFGSKKDISAEVKKLVASPHGALDKVCKK